MACNSRTLLRKSVFGEMDKYVNALYFQNLKDAFQSL